jgi:hypothetical protein
MKLAGALHQELDFKNDVTWQLRWRRSASKPLARDLTSERFRSVDYSDVKRPMIYTQVLNRGPSGMNSPADVL